MADLLLVLTLICWCIAALVCLAGSSAAWGRLLLVLGCAAALLWCLISLPSGAAPIDFAGGLGAGHLGLDFAPSAIWLMLFGMVAALLACWLGSPLPDRRGWVAGTTLAMIGALGVFFVSDAIAFLVAWEIMSLGGACMLLADRHNTSDGRRVLMMLGLLEVGSVSLVAAFLILGNAAGDYDFSVFHQAVLSLSPTMQLITGVLLLIGFGAKLGLLPFYEWFPEAYGSGSGASGNILSGLVLNAAFFGLGRGFVEWFGGSPMLLSLGAVLIIVGVISAVLTILYAFQEDDWRELLSFSTAENASIAVTVLGASLLFLSDGHQELAALAWTVSLLHLAGHALAKGALFLTADGVFDATGSYSLVQRGLLWRSPLLLGIGAVFAAMSLAAMPPQAGFVSEWYVFETVFQGFHLETMTGRLIMALAGAGLALTAAVAFATFIKIIGIGLQGRSRWETIPIRLGTAVATGLLGIAVLVLAVGMPWWIGALHDSVASDFGTPATTAMRDGWMLVPLTAKFAFISPTLLAIVCPLLALLPLGLLLVSKRFPVRRAPVWYGGLSGDSNRVATTSLTFANAMRTFYGFIYRPILDVT
ncbi:MAG: proton-conducting transporter membrane subunit, partial [Gammaproteobacteria bacterium]